MNAHIFPLYFVVLRMVLAKKERRVVRRSFLQLCFWGSVLLTPFPLPTILPVLPGLFSPKGRTAWE